MPTARKSQSGPVLEIQILEVKQGALTVYVHGTTPLIINRMSEKARRELLLPRGRKTAADKASSLKHNPYEEFRAAPYTLREDGAPTLLAMPNEAFKGTICAAALDLPGASKAQIGRLVSVEGHMVPIYGEPQLLMSVVRSADINHTPDVRTRVIVSQWCAQVTVTYVTPQLREQGIMNLFAAAGITSGIGDWRQQKGKGSYGQFELVGAKDANVARLMKEWGRAAQIAAMEHPTPYDQETEELLSWFDEEAPARGFSIVPTEEVA